MSKNFKGKVTIYFSRNTVLTMNVGDFAEIQINEWEVFPVPNTKNLCTVFIPKRSQVFFVREGIPPKQTLNGDDAFYVSIQRISGKTTNAEDYIIDVSGNENISEFEFPPLTDAQAAANVVSGDYLIFENVPFEATFSYIIDSEDDENLYKIISNDVKYHLEDFDLLLIDQYDTETLVAYRDLAVEGKNPDYQIAAAIRDHLVFKNKKNKDKKDN